MTDFDPTDRMNGCFPNPSSILGTFLYDNDSCIVIGVRIVEFEKLAVRKFVEANSTFRHRDRELGPSGDGALGDNYLRFHVPTERRLEFYDLLCDMAWDGDKDSFVSIKAGGKGKPMVPDYYRGELAKEMKLEHSIRARNSGKMPDSTPDGAGGGTPGGRF